MFKFFRILLVFCLLGLISIYVLKKYDILRDDKMIKFFVDYVMIGNMRVDIILS